jgi:hypothetical protein
VIDQADGLLKAWVAQILGPVNVTLDPPGTAQTGQGVSLYLMALVHAFPSNGGQRPPLKIELRYLLTVWADDPEAAHVILGKLVFAALANSEFEVDLNPLPAEFWLSLATPPKPAFVLRVPLRLERPEPAAPFVRTPLVVQSSPITDLRGQILGPGDIPLSGMRVELPSLQLSTRTDAQGYFYFPTVSSESKTRELRISGKGRELNITVEQPASASEPLVIHFSPLSEKGG